VAALYTDNKEVIILTKDATPELAVVHHRMPVILSHEEVNVWLHPKNTKVLNDVINKSLLKKEKEIWKNVGCAKLAPYVSSIK
jgi:putative SOS response-associated peptidase YedK